MARLLQRTERGDQAHDLLFQNTSIGRGWLNDIVIEDPGERRLHAEILALDQGRYTIRDNRSRGGVLVNGERVAGVRALADGDVLRVGRAEFVFEGNGSQPGGAGVPPASGQDACSTPTLPSAGRRGGVMQLTAGTLLARVFGYVRELVATAYFGLSSGLYDAYVAASRIPNLLRDVLGEQAAESAFMPAHRTLETRGRPGEAERLLRSVVWVVVGLGAALVALCIWAAPWLVLAVVPGFQSKHPELMATATRLARWMMPFLLIIAVASVYGSLLLAHRRFWRYSVAPLAASVAMILAVVFLTGRLGVGSLALGVVAGGIAQMLISAAPYVRRGQWRPLFERPLVNWRQPALRKVGRSVIPVASAAVLSRLGNIVDCILASRFCVLGSISALYEAFRLLQLPFGVFALAVSRAAFPTMIERASTQDDAGFSRAVTRAMRLNMFLLLPPTVGMIVLATPLVRVLYERGHFTPGDTELTVLALICYAVGLVTMGSRTVLARGFYALLNTRTPFYIAAVDVAANIVLSVLLVRTSLRHGGLALATSLASILHAWLLKVMLAREMARQGRRLTLTGLNGAMLRLGGAGAAMALCSWGCLRGLAALGLSRGFLGNALCVIIPGTLGFAAYVGAAILLRCEEVKQLWRWRRVDTAPKGG